MSNESSLQPSIERLTTYVRKQYKSTFDYHSVDNFAKFASEELLKKVSSNSCVIEKNWIYYGVYENEKLVGVARVSRTTELDERAHHSLQTIIQAVFDSRFSITDSLHQLDFVEDQLRDLSNTDFYEQQRSVTKMQNNVVSIQIARKNQFPLPTKSQNTHFNFAFLIESKNPEDIFKMALEIHTRSQRFAFIPIEDLDPAVLSDVTALRALGETSIFIKELSGLSPEQQKFIIQYHQSNRDKMGPQFIVGTTLPIKSLSVNPELIRSLMIGYLRMTEPFRVYRERDILEFFFDSLTGRAYHE